MTTRQDDHTCPSCFGDTGGEDPCPRCGLGSDAPRPANALPLGSVLNGQFVIGRVLGKPGGFGISYLALDRNLRARVAIKEYLPRDLVTRANDRGTIVPHTDDEASLFQFGLTQFVAEGQTLAQLDHPNIVRVRQYFEANGSAYLAMDYYRGMTLAEYLDRQPDGRMPEDKALALMQPVLDGLRAVHATDFLHRDIKPGNIYLAQTETGGVRPILLDFGAARQAFGERSRSISVVLTEGYAPFEQYRRNGRQGPWTDVYGAAAVLYRMLTGRDPDAATDRQAEDRLVPAARFGVSKPLSDVLALALSVRPEQRPQTVGDFQRLLHEARQGMGPLPVTGPARVEPAVRPEPHSGVDPSGQSLTDRTGHRPVPPADARERDYRAVIGNRVTDFYLKPFRRIDANAGDATAGWNWAAFFFGTWWFFYRRMWLTGAGLFVAKLFAMGLVGSILMDGFAVAEDPAMGVAWLIWVFVHLTITAYANWFYYRRADDLIRKADRRFPSDPVARSGFLQAHGGTSSIVLWLLLIPAIGILLAIAIPSYAEYTLRARIAGVLSVSAAYRAAVQEYRIDKRQWPGSLATIEQPASFQVGGIAVDVALADAGMLVFTLADAGDLTGRSLVVYPQLQDGKIVWLCGSEDIAQNLLPARCRD